MRCEEHCLSLNCQLLVNVRSAKYNFFTMFQNTQNAICINYYIIINKVVGMTSFVCNLSTNSSLNFKKNDCDDLIACQTIFGQLGPIMLI